MHCSAFAFGTEIGVDSVPAQACTVVSLSMCQCAVVLCSVSCLVQAASVNPGAASGLRRSPGPSSPGMHPHTMEGGCTLWPVPPHAALALASPSSPDMHNTPSSVSAWIGFDAGLITSMLAMAPIYAPCFFDKNALHALLYACVCVCVCVCVSS